MEFVLKLFRKERKVITIIRESDVSLIKSRTLSSAEKIVDRAVGEYEEYMKNLRAKKAY